MAGLRRGAASGKNSKHMTVKIDVQALKVGMFVHLDLSWMSHPFPLSSFRIANQDQIDTIRALGLKEVRWSPDRSELTAEAPPPSSAPAASVVTAADTEAAQARTRREALTAQRAAQAVAERQYAEAAQAYRGLVDRLDTAPEAAREQAEALARAMLDKMLGDHELSIRTLPHGAGEQATAHALNVTIVSLLMARAFGMDEHELLDVGVGALMHDIGKTELPDRLRFPDEAMTGVEQSVYREHVAHGVRQGRRMGLSPGALLVIAQHHEQADGSGFPQHLPIERLSGPARVVAMVNRYDNLCNPSSPAKAVTPHEALSMLFSQGRQKYDSTMLAGFIRMMGVYPPGSLVQLTDDRYAMVMSVNGSRPLKPRVLVHDPKVPRDEALIVDLEHCQDLGVRRSLKPAQVPPASLDYLGPGRRITYFFEAVRAPRRHDEEERG